MAYIYDLVDTWASGGGPYTSIKMNATDNDVGSASLLMNLQVGGTSKFSVTKSGGVDCAWSGNAYLRLDGEDFQHFNASGIRDMLIGGNGIGVALPSNYFVSWGTTSTTPLTRDLYLRRRGSANLALGAADAASGVQAQTLSVQSITGTNASAAAYPFKITGAQGTGNAAGGSIIFQVAPAGGAGPAQNTPVDALTIDSTRLATFAFAAAFPNGTTSTLPIQISSAAYGFYRGSAGGGGAVITTCAGVDIFAVGQNSGVGVVNTGPYSWASTIASTQDLFLYRDAANTLALRNGTAAQTFNLYGTYTDGSNYERLRFSFPASGPATIISESAGTGLARPLTLTATGSAYIQFNTAATDRWFINSSGHFLANTDNLYDIGASGATRPRSVYTGSSVYFGGDVFCANGIFFGGASYTKGYIYSNSDGVWSLNNSTSTSFGRLQFGGTTSSFPAIKRSSTTLQARLADDSAFASVQGKLTTDTNYTAGTFTATGYLTLYDAAGTAYRVPCAV